MIDGYFASAGTQYHVDISVLRRVAVCESGYNTYARNGPYAGMFQFASSTWVATRATMGLSTDPDLRFNPEQAIDTAAFKIAAGEGKQAWPGCY